MFTFNKRGPLNTVSGGWVRSPNTTRGGATFIPNGRLQSDVHVDREHVDQHLVDGLDVLLRD